MLKSTANTLFEVASSVESTLTSSPQVLRLMLEPTTFNLFMLEPTTVTLLMLEPLQLLCLCLSQLQLDYLCLSHYSCSVYA